MPRPSKSRKNSSPTPSTSRENPHPDHAHVHPDIDPRWLLKMLGLVLGVALLCAYLTLCGLFYQGQWQFILHPDIANKTTPATISLPFEDVSFDYTGTGQPQLHGWWIPAPPAPAGTVPSRYSAVTVLYLHGGSGCLADALPRLQELHNLGMNVFAFDYRGFGQSAGPHPTESRMHEDTAAAWQYVTYQRKVPATQIIPYGEGIGGAMAAQILLDHPRIPAVILDGPIFDIAPQVSQDPRSTLIPVRLLLHEHFSLAALAAAETPKLLLLNDGPQSPTPAVLNTVADPKITLHLGGFTPEQAANARSQFLSRFLDEYLPDPALVPQQ
jgi:pimeloyl-ACP methyl ester carboxylesterase